MTDEIIIPKVPLERLAPGEYVTRDGKYSISRDYTGLWNLFTEPRHDWINDYYTKAEAVSVLQVKKYFGEY